MRCAGSGGSAFHAHGELLAATANANANANANAKELARASLLNNNA
jgi:hypothetical protein